MVRIIPARESSFAKSGGKRGRANLKAIAGREKVDEPIYT